MPNETALQAAINGNLDSFIVRETLRELKGKKSFTMAELRAARNKALGGSNV